ncbi:MAG: hypothetical protein U0237_02640 [Thermoleophilia bacterium]
MTRRSARATGLTALAALCAAAAIPAAAGAVDTDYVDFPMCSDAVTTSCIRSLEVDVSGTGDFTAPPGDLTPKATLSGTRPPIPDGDYSQMDIRVQRGGLDDLSPALTTASRIRISVDLGPFTPDRLMFASADVISWTSEPTPSGTSIHTWVMRPITKTIGIPCDTEVCTGPFTYLQDRAAMAGLYLMDAPSASPAQQEMDRQSQGSWVASNASSSTNAYMDADTNALRVDVASPHLTAAGELNTGFLSGFVPDALIRGGFETTPEALAERGVLLSSDDGTTQEVQASITRVDGGVMFRAEGFHYSTPSFSFLSRRPATLGRLTVTPSRGSARRLTVEGWVTASGRLTTASCSGRVAITARVGGRTITAPAARLRLTGDRCGYRGTVTVPGRRRGATAVIRASFAGNLYLIGDRAPGRVVRLG